MRQKRITRLSAILAILLSLWTIYYLYDFVWGLIEIRFFKPNHIAETYGIAPELVTGSIKNVLFFAWMPSILLGLLGFIFGVIGAYNVYRGRMFDPSALWPVVGIGIVTCLSLPLGVWAYNFEIDLIWPLTGKKPLERDWFWTPSDVTVFFFGIGFILLGYLQIESARLLRENKEFV